MIDGTSNRRGWLIAGGFFFLPIVLVALVFWQRSTWFSTYPPNYIWRFAYCFFAGCWGLSVRAYERRKKLSIDYFVLYPVVLFINACAVFTFLMLFADKLGGLFWTAAVPTAVILGRYANPHEWRLTKLLAGVRDKAD